MTNKDSYEILTTLISDIGLDANKELQEFNRKTSYKYSLMVKGAIERLLKETQYLTYSMGVFHIYPELTVDILRNGRDPDEISDEEYEEYNSEIDAAEDLTDAIKQITNLSFTENLDITYAWDTDENGDIIVRGKAK